MAKPITIKNIVSFSSEHGQDSADNLLLPASSGRAWRGQPDLNGNTVELQLEKATRIGKLRLGNAGSAFVEVLVGQSAWPPNTEYKVLLPMSALMSRAEADEPSQHCGIRVFGKTLLEAAVQAAKWDRVRLFVRQQYKPDMPYGLSFVEIISDDAQLLGASPAPASHPISNSHTDLLKGGGEGEFRLGSFTVRAEKQPSVSLASFFKAAPGPRPGPEPGSVSPAPEASRAQAVTEAAKKRRQDAKGLAPKAVGAVHTDAPAARPGKRPMEKNDEGNAAAKKANKADDSGVKGPGKKPPPRGNEAAVHEAAPAAQAAPADPRDIKKILKGVVFVLSGFVDPRRGELRKKAIELGAWYERDWGPRCTHCVCAFPNTPKYIEVLASGHGAIVTDQWVDDCYDKRRRLQEAAYGFGASNDSDSSSLAADDADGDADWAPGRAHEAGEDLDLDTEEEVELIKKQQAQAQAGSIAKGQVQARDGALPMFLHRVRALLYGAFPADKRVLLERYMVAYGGRVADQMDDDVTHVLTDADWDSRLDEWAREEPDLAIVQSDWLIQCHNRQCKLQPYAYSVRP